MTQVQIARSSVPGARPAAGSQPVGSLYLNFADQKLGYIDPAGTPIDLPTGGDAPVTSVNTKVGDVVLTAADVGAADATHDHDGVYAPVDHTHPLLSADADNYSRLGADGLIYTPTPAATTAPVTSVNAKTGDVVLTAADVGAADAAHLHDDRYSLLGHNHDGVYAPAVHGHDATYVIRTGDTMSGNLEIQKTLPKLTLHYPGSLFWDFYINAGDGGVQNNSGRWIWYSNNTDFFVPGNLVSYWSDARLKEAVRDLDGYEERIMGLRPVSFSWNKKGRELTNRKYREREIGFIAQEAQSVSDQYVAENPLAKTDEGDAYLTVQKDEMIADLVATVKSLVTRVRELEAKVNGTV